MPKRPPTPPPGDDEPKYLTCYYPFPHLANMEVVGDRMEMARWLGSVIPKEQLYAIFHKPTAPNMVILEVSRDIGDSQWPGILGAHEWSKCFRNPSEAERHLVTRIYFCAFSTTRQVEKAGWKRIDIRDEWYHGWHENNKFVVYPYPRPTWCPIPSAGEDKIGVALCRPIPERFFKMVIEPPPPQPSTKIVGSSSWVDRKKITQASLDRWADDDEGSLDSYALDSVIFTEASLPSSSATPVWTPLTTPMSDDDDGYSNVWAEPDEDHPKRKTSRAPTQGAFGTLATASAADPHGGIICPSHGARCKRGICVEFKAAEREYNKHFLEQNPSVANKSRGPGRGNWRRGRGGGDMGGSQRGTSSIDRSPSTDQGRSTPSVGVPEDSVSVVEDEDGTFKSVNNKKKGFGAGVGKGLHVRGANSGQAGRGAWGGSR